MDKSKRLRIRGVEAVVQQVAEILRHDMTPAEHTLWKALRDRQLDGIKFRRQAPIGQFILDFYAPSYRLVVEVDGDVHEKQKEHDEARTQHLRAYGYHVIRFQNAEIIDNLPLVLESIRHTILALSKDQLTLSDNT